MSGSKRRQKLLALILVGSGVFLVYRWMTATSDLVDALQQGTVNARIVLVTPPDGGPLKWLDAARADPHAAYDTTGGRPWATDGGSLARITIVRTNNSARTIRVMVPPGTLLHSSHRDEQRLMTVHKALFELDKSSKKETIDVPVLCVDEFKTPPAGGAGLAPSALVADDADTTSGIKPTRDLVSCLDQADMSASNEQIAAWTANSDLLHRSRADAIEELTDRLVAKMTKERRAQLESERAELESGSPDATQQKISTAIEAEMTAGMSDLREAAAERAKSQIQAFVAHDRDALSSCGYDVASLPLFN
jgi:hypothetical protein